MELKKKYMEQKPVGTYCVSNCICIVFYEPDEEDRPDYDYICAAALSDIGYKDFIGVNVEYVWDDNDEEDTRAVVRYFDMTIPMEEVLRC